MVGGERPDRGHGRHRARDHGEAGHAAGGAGRTRRRPTHAPAAAAAAAAASKPRVRAGGCPPAAPLARLALPAPLGRGGEPEAVQVPARGAALAQQEVPVRAGPAAARARRRRVERVAVRRRARARGRRDVFPKLRRIRFRISRGRRRDAARRFRHLAESRLGEPASVFATSAIARSTKRVVSSRGGALLRVSSRELSGAPKRFRFCETVRRSAVRRSAARRPPTSGARGGAARGRARFDRLARRRTSRRARDRRSRRGHTRAH